MPARTTLAAFALLAVFFAAALTESRIKSPMSDEPPHLFSGLSYVAARSFQGNPQHPPLLKDLSGLSLLAGGIRLPRNAETEAFLQGRKAPGEQPEWQLGNKLIVANGVDRVMFWARLPLILVACLLGAVIYLWGRQLLGSAAAVGAVLLFIVDPTILGHSFSVTTDIGLAAFSLLFFFALWNYLADRSVKRLVFCGLALGAMLGAKFSAVLLLPVAIVLLAASLFWPVSAEAVSPKDFDRAGPNERCPCGSGKKYKACHGARASGAMARTVPPDLMGKLTALGGVWLAICGIAFVVVQALYLFPSNPLVYFDGLKLVNADHNPDYLCYLGGEVRHRFPSYFATAYLLKEPIATLALAGIGLVALLRRRKFPVATKLFLLLPPAAIFLGATLWADNLGVRYIMPVFPLGHLLGGLGLATLLGMPARWAKVAAVALAGWAVVVACGIYPDHLSYFNEAACVLTEPARIGFDGGSKCGTAWLDDSNVDWGQGLKQLAGWLNQHAPGRSIHLANSFGSPAEAFGIHYTTADMDELTGTPPPGLYAVSAHLVARVPAHPGVNDWLRRTAPIAVVGHAIYLYEIPVPHKDASPF